MIERLKSKVFYCRRHSPLDEGYVEGVETFAAPVVRFLNLRDLSGEAMLVTAGEIKTGTLICKTYDEYAEKSRLYITKEPPAEFDGMCTDADYTVVSADVANRPKTVVLQRLVADGV